MNKEDLKYFKIIGKLHSGLSSSKSFDEAVTSCLKIILSESVADYAVIWKADRSDRPVLRPMYWICPVDLSSLKCVTGEGIVGRVYETQIAKTVFDCSKDTEYSMKEDFSGIDISSVTCLPLNSGDYNYGCIQFIKAVESGQFTQDDADTCELLTLMAQIELDARDYAEDFPLQKEVLMSVRNVHKYFQSGETVLHVLKGINLDIYAGEFLCLLGESGCGKSTMLNIIGGLLEFEEGSILFEGKNIADSSQAGLTDYRKKHIGFIFQSYNLMPNLTAKQNIDLIGELVDSPEDSEKLLSLVGLADKADSYPSQLSGGQQQRVAFARAMVKKPRLILADEPTAALDYKTSIEVLSVMENIVKDGTTLILVTHNEEIARMADRVVRFRDGKMYEVRVNAHPLHATDLVW